MSVGGPPPSLSVIIPTLDESAHVGVLLRGLAQQRGLGPIEVIVADGGSSDHTLAAALSAVSDELRLRTVQCGRGRGRQMNAAARMARSADLLFLHADTRIEEPRLLAAAAMAVSARRAAAGTDRVAGHFALHFARDDPYRHRLAYRYFEAKTRLCRPESINGDQGLWIARRYFAELGGFDESLPYMEDARLARQIFRGGEWMTLPGTLQTSARRFASEGLGRRQVLNAMLRTCDAVGLHEFLAAAPGAYREQRRTTRLELSPFLVLLWRAMWRPGVRPGLRYCWRVARFAAGQAWQIPLLMIVVASGWLARGR